MYLHICPYTFYFITDISIIELAMHFPSGLCMKMLPFAGDWNFLSFSPSFRGEELFKLRPTS